MGGRSPYLHVPVQLIRELRSPQRQRFASARHGQDLRALRRPAWRHTAVHPLESLRRLVGSGDRDGPVWGVTMVRDEEVRVRGAIERLFAGGVDAVLVADHGSTDATVEVLRSIALDLPVLIVADREPAYYQGPKMSRLARAAARCGASWVVPFDADELWFGTDEPLAAALRHLDGDIAVAALYDYLPAIDADPLASRRPYQTQTRRRPSSLTSKVAFRAHHLAALSSGNHLVSQPGRRVHDRIRIRHFPFLDYEHFVRKAITGVAALARTDYTDAISSHWHEWAAAPETRRRELWAAITSSETIEDPLPPFSFLGDAS